VDERDANERRGNEGDERDANERRGNEGDERSRRSVLRWLAGAAGTGAAVGAFGGGRATARTPPVTLIHGTQFHGRFGGRDRANVSRYATVVDGLREARPNAVVLGTGDDLAKRPLATPFVGRHITDALNYLRPTAATIGNHEFDYGAGVLARRTSESSFPWVSTNLLTADGSPVPGSRRWVTRTVGGVTVGIFGLAPQNVAETEPGFPDAYRVIDNVIAARTAVRNLEAAGAEYVVCASHLALAGAETVAKRVDGVDAIIGDHAEHVFDEPRVIDGTVVDTVGDAFHRVGAVTLGNGGVKDWQRVEVTPDVRRDRGMASVVRKWRRRVSVGGAVVSFPP
jgi:2',3'-cyclic-nucleotide 2'-phosphodiesterase (5'-nucleotidase family)